MKHVVCKNNNWWVKLFNKSHKVVTYTFLLTLGKIVRISNSADIQWLTYKLLISYGKTDRISNNTGEKNITW